MLFYEPKSTDREHLPFNYSALTKGFRKLKLIKKLRKINSSEFLNLIKIYYFLTTLIVFEAPSSLLNLTIYI
jgi:hypothetical protein